MPRLKGEKTVMQSTNSSGSLPDPFPPNTRRKQKLQHQKSKKRTIKSRCFPNLLSQRRSTRVLFLDNDNQTKQTSPLRQPPNPIIFRVKPFARSNTTVPYLSSCRKHYAKAV